MTTLYTLTITETGEYHFKPAAQQNGGKLLSVPWVGQNTARDDDDFSKSDCGSAVVCEWLRYRGVTVSVDEVSKATGKAPGYTYTTFSDLDRAANAYGLDLVYQYGTLTPSIIKEEIDKGQPVIALVYYQALPHKSDPLYKFSHWILLVGYDGDTFFYHDPYWKTAADGANLTMTETQLVNALQQVSLNGNTPRQGATQK